ncbi:MAG: primosomal protein N' [Thermomicrobiales bacterium]|nr:primosomal protein N' [Thermomicrobiales bacterium]
MEPSAATGTPGPIWIRVATEGTPVHLDGGVLTYAAPKGDVPSRGQLIRVPLRNRLVLGFVVGFTHEKPEFATRPISDPISPTFILTETQFDIATRMAHETVSSFFGCAALFLPPGRRWKAIDVYTLNPDFDLASATFTAAQRQVMSELEIEEELTLDALRQRTGRKLTGVLADLVKIGAIHRWQRPENALPKARMVKVIRLRNPDAPLAATARRQHAVLAAIVEASKESDHPDDVIPLTTIQAMTDVPSGVLDALAKKGAILVEELPAHKAPQPRASRIPTLSPPQQKVWREVEEALKSGDTKPHLLFGVTGSGKTEIYLRAVAWCLRHQRTALILVPEIALATQVVRRFIDRFPGRVDVLHSQMTDSQRYDLWTRIDAGEVDVVVGPRSALFAPIKRLGLIVIDEEHDSSFKQDNDPRYHARAVAEQLATLSGAVVIMGSATPSIETMWRAQAGEMHLLELSHRVSPHMADGAPLGLPEVRIVDLRAELRAGNNDLISRELQTQIERSLSAQEQAIVLLNRRGMSTVVLCRDNGHRISCPNCDIPMVYHADMRLMICHRCDHRTPPPQRCPECDSRLDYLGAGTQRVEESVRNIWPEARVMRWDADAVRQFGYQTMLDRAEDHAVDIIVGTQMVSKGFDLPRVTTIGVIQADSMLYLPDFRSSERTFQLLTQVAGRAGRRTSGSVVVFQTYTPGHYAVRAASKHDYPGFYAEEVGFRERFRFPPFHRLARFVYKGDDERETAIEAEMLARALSLHAYRKHIEMEILGPSPAFVARIRNQYQWQLVVRTLQMEEFLDGMPIRPGWVIDIDPESML